LKKTLRANPHLDAIVTLTSAATRGTFAALGRGTSKRTAKVVAFDDPDVFLLPWQENLDSVIVQNSREMGFAAVNTIAAQLRGDPVPAQVKLKPILVTRENADSSGVRRMFSMIWRLQQ
jgi:ribose transport system substrate-binding protein